MPSHCQDLNDLAAIPGLVRRIIDRHGHIDILVNNAGINMKKELPDVTDEEFDRILHDQCPVRFRLVAAK